MAINLENQIVTVLPDGRMDAKNAAAYCGLSVKTLAMKRCDSTGPTYIKMGKVFYYQLDLDTWLRSGRSSSTAQSRRIAGAHEKVGDGSTAQQ